MHYTAGDLENLETALLKAWQLDGQWGYLVTLCDANALAKKPELILPNAETGEEFDIGGQPFASQHYSTQKSAEHLLSRLNILKRA